MFYQIVRLMYVRNRPSSSYNQSRLVFTQRTFLKNLQLIFLMFLHSCYPNISAPEFTIDPPRLSNKLHLSLAFKSIWLNTINRLWRATSDRCAIDFWVWNHFPFLKSLTPKYLKLFTISSILLSYVKLNLSVALFFKYHDLCFTCIHF